MKNKDYEILCEGFLDENDNWTETHDDYNFYTDDKDKKELYKLKINILKDSEDTNTSTALTSYIDPRIVIDICKEQNIPIDKIYTKTLLRYFNYLIN